MSSHESEERKDPPRAFPQFSRYDVREVPGEGATSAVSSAWDRELRRPVAIKLLRESAGLSDLARQRFRRETQAAEKQGGPQVRQDLESALDLGGSTGAHRDEAEAALRRVRDTK